MAYYTDDYKKALEDANTNDSFFPILRSYDYIIGKAYLCKPQSAVTKRTKEGKRLTICVYDEVEGEGGQMKQTLKITFLPPSYLESKKKALGILKLFEITNKNVYIVLKSLIKGNKDILIPEFEFIVKEKNE